MATKSSNTKGNPWHDESGQFTSEENQGRKLGDFKNGQKEDNIKLKSDLTQEKLKDILNKTNVGSNQKNIETIVFGTLVMPKTIQEAEQQGNQILGTNANIVGYDNNTDVESAFDMNKSLYLVKQDFGNLFNDATLISYGNANKRINNYGNQNFDNIKNTLQQKLRQEILNMGGLATTDLEKEKLLNNLTRMFLGNLSRYNTEQLDKDTGGVTITSNIAMQQNGNLQEFKPFSSIKINPINSSNYKEYNRKEEEWLNRNKGYFFYDFSKYNAIMYDSAHELGHFVRYQLLNVFNQDEFNELNSLLSRGPFGNKEKFLSLHYTFNAISYYATTSREEHIAEAFADYYCNGKKATNHNKRIVEYLKSIYNKYYGQK